ncbi:MAG: 4'-phosphopantetheinyl transferase family protein, partial [Cyanobium sp.]
LQPLHWTPGQPLPLQELQTTLGVGGSAPRAAVLLVEQRAMAPEAWRVVTTSVVNERERQRAQRFRRPEDQQRHLLGRAALRLLLGAWLDRDPAALRFHYGRHGKPLLEGWAGGGPHFNLAHSGDLILLALHPSRPVGVDVERQRPDLDWRPIAARILPPHELEILEALAPVLQPQGFLRAWCRLEARLKASGEGLAGLERLRRAPMQTAARPELWDVAVPMGYGAAVALAPPA